MNKAARGRPIPECNARCGYAAAAGWGMRSSVGLLDGLSGDVMFEMVLVGVVELPLVEAFNLHCSSIAESSTGVHCVKDNK